MFRAPRFILIIVVSLSLTACQTTRSGNTYDRPFIHAKMDMTGKGLVSDMNSCRASSKHATAPSTGGGVYYGNVIGILIGAMIVGAIQGYQNAKAKDIAYYNCMENRSYLPFPASKAVLEEFRDADEAEDKAAVIDQYLASADFQIVRDWDKTESLNTIPGYQAFLARHPALAFSPQIETKIAALERSAREAKERETAIKSIRKSGFLFAGVDSFKGIGPDGWYPTKAEDNSIQHYCTRKSEATLKLAIDEGVGQGYLTISGARPVAVSAVIQENGDFEIRSDWPKDDPLRITSSFDRRDTFSGRTRGTKYMKCDQYTWFKLPTEAPANENAAIEEWLGGPLRPRADVQAAYDSAGPAIQIVDPKEAEEKKITAEAKAKAEAAAWEKAEAANTNTSYWKYLRSFPAGKNAKNARMALKALREAKAAGLTAESTNPEPSPQKVSLVSGPVRLVMEGLESRSVESHACKPGQRIVLEGVLENGGGKFSARDPLDASVSILISPKGDRYTAKIKMRDLSSNYHEEITLKPRGSTAAAEYLLRSLSANNKICKGKLTLIKQEPLSETG